MNELTTQICSNMLPYAALIAYRIEDRGNRDDSNDYFLETRRIGADGRMGEAVPVSYELMNEIASGYSEVHNEVPHGVIPSNMLYADTRKGYEKYVWYDLPRRRVQYFSKGLAIDDGEYHVPGIVYVAHKKRLSVFAFRGGDCTPDTELFRAPFFNVYDTGDVCLGSAKAVSPSDPTFADVMHYWETKFWKSEFTSLLGSNPTAANLVLVTKTAKHTPFDVNMLLPIKKKVKNLIR